MKEIRLKLADIFEVEPERTDRPKDIAAITAYVLKHYAFLPKPIAVMLEDDEVVISYPGEDDTKRAEAARLADRAVKRASEGQYDKAIGIYKRAFDLVIIVPTVQARTKIAIIGEPVSPQYRPKDPSHWPGRPDRYRVRVDLRNIRYSTVDKVRAAVVKAGG